MLPIPEPARWIVLKFGGTSVSRRERWDTIGRLASDRAAGNTRVLVVVSALSGVTNALAAIADGGADAAAQVDALDARHREFAVALGLDPDVVLADRLGALRTLAAEQRAATRPLDWQAEVLAQGELLSSTLGAATCARRGWSSAGAMPATGCMRWLAQPDEWGAAAVGDLPARGRRRLAVRGLPRSWR